MTLQEALTLYPECEEFERTAILPDDSLVRKLAREIYGKARLTHMEAVCTEVWHTIAKEFVSQRAALDAAGQKS